MVHIGAKFTETESRIMSAKGGWEENRSYCLMGTEFPTWDEFWSWMVVTVIGQCDGVINATELYT